MDWHAIYKGGVEIPLVINAIETGDMCQPDGPLGSYPALSNLSTCNNGYTVTLKMPVVPAHMKYLSAIIIARQLISTG